LAGTVIYFYGGFKMKAKYKETIDGHTVVMFIANAAADPERTKRKIAPMVKPDMSGQDIERLCMENLAYAKAGPEAELIEDKAAGQIQVKLDKKGANRLLLENGGYIADYRGVECWSRNKKPGGWAKEKIEKTGIELPASAVMQENLSQEQNAEIAAQQRAKQIAALPPEERAKAEQAELDALADEAARLEKRAEIQGEPFDPKAWFREQIMAVEVKYA
jgi:hypothetical protein